MSENSNNYIAHTSDDGRVQSVKEHLAQTAKLCRDNALPEFKDLAGCCGLYHDLGKYSPEFQKYIRGSGQKVEHARFGASRIINNCKASYAAMLAYCICGHHAGLPDGGVRNDNPEQSTLNGMLKREPYDCSGFDKEIGDRFPDDPLFEKLKNLPDNKEQIEVYSFFTRYLYSCLTDADFIDTERFCAPDAKRGLDGDIIAAYKMVCEKLDGFKCETELQKARSVIQAQAYDCAENKDADIYMLDMPTGSGKTLCSIKAALRLAIKNDKKRIIYIMPYTSIIEQTAEVFEDIFGNSLLVLQHHSNYDFDDPEKESDESGTTSEKLKKTCENYDAPLIITTNVQFFESLYHNKSSRLRKLHNLAESVLVFDEIHALPAEYIQPCLRGIGYITKYLNSTAILMSATMPDYTRYAEKYIPQSTIEYAVKDKSLFGIFDKCKYQYIGRNDLGSIAEKALGQENALVIVNKKSTARELYNICKNSADHKVYHLSTYMTPIDRSDTISRIRASLDNGTKTVVISTSLIEAGVDLDFKSVFREIAGLDSIVQAGGRCNREGRMSFGNVFVFELGSLHREIAVKANITRKLFEEFENISSQEAVQEYYDRIFAVSDDEIETNSITELMGGDMRVTGIPFRSYAQRFKFIEKEALGIVIPCEENAELIESLKYGARSAMRKLQRYCASVNKYEFDDMIESGTVENLFGNVYMLSVPDYYSKETGLDIKKEFNLII